ncbi:MAG: acyltransferase [Saprospiraceae bacterium]|nr:acyltransferase [Saprospiraceae bacterium]
MKKIAKEIFGSVYLLYLGIVKKIFGIRPIVNKLEHCKTFLIPLILKKFHATVGDRVTCKKGLAIENAYEDQSSTHDFSRLKIGDSCFIGSYVMLDLTDRITIGHNVCISARSSLITHFDVGNRPLSAKYPRRTGAIVIGDNCYIGLGAIILHGVTLGNNCVVGAGALVKDSFPDDSTIVGNPGTNKN